MDVEDIPGIQVVKDVAVQKTIEQKVFSSTVGGTERNIKD